VKEQQEIWSNEGYRKQWLWLHKEDESKFQRFQEKNIKF